MFLSDTLNYVTRCKLLSLTYINNLDLFVDILLTIQTDEGNGQARDETAIILTNLTNGGMDG